jgi:hypothetical protein
MEYNVVHYGATGDGTTDDTAAIQSAIDSALAAGGGIVFFPAGGTYIVSQLNVSEGLIIEGYGATVKRPANQSKWTRTFTTTVAGYLYDGSADSKPLIFQGLTIDGNRQNQGAYGNYELEQAHLIFLMGNAANSGKLRAVIEDCYFKDCVADAISVYTNVSVQISNCTAVDCFRGGVVVTGGYSDVQVNNFKAHGTVHETGIDVELDGPGYGNTLKTDITMNNLYLPDGDFDVAVLQGSTFTGSNIIVNKPPFNLYAENSTVKIMNSVFHVGVLDDYLDRIVSPYDVTFQNCTFYAHKPAGTTGNRSIACIHLFQFGNANQTLRFLDCDFKADSSVGAGDTVYAIYFEGDQLAKNNRVIVEGGSISNRFNYGLYWKFGGRAVVRNTYVEASTCFYFGVTSGGYDYDVTLDGTIAKNHTKLLEIAAGNSSCKLTTKNIVLTESENTLSLGSGATSVSYGGGRLIQGNSSPISRSVPGLPHDVFRLNTAVPGADYEWVCTTGSGTAATWKRRTTLGS